MFFCVIFIPDRALNMAAAAGPMPAGGAPPGQGPQISCFDPSKKHSEVRTTVVAIESKTPVQSSLDL